jgi:hypothetical protein
VGPVADARAARVAALVDRARALGLARELAWYRLGHWRETLTGNRESQIDGPSFFLAEDGKTSPAAELEATVSAFFSDPPAQAPEGWQHPVCRFPARWRWLSGRLGLGEDELPPHDCSRFRQWAALADAGSITMVFSSYYLNNPSSAAGHTFMRLNRKTRPDEERRDLLEVGVDFSASVDTQNALVYGVKGLLGLFPGQFHRMPYYRKVREYNDVDARDIWEYDLVLTQAEVDQLVAHLWELSDTWIDYWYLSENCSYHMLGVLEAAAPRLVLLDHVHWPVLPADTMKILARTPGLTRTARFRPSIRTQFDTRARELSGDEADLVARLADRPDTPLPADLPPARRIAVLDGAQDLVDVRHGRDLPWDLAGEGGQKKQALLERRAEIALPSPELVVDVPWDKRPDAGRDPRRLMLLGGVRMGVGELRGQRLAAASLAGRLGLHDLADPAAGYPDTAGIEFLPFRATVVETPAGDRQFLLDELDLVRITSLRGVGRFDHGISWRLRAGGLRLYEAGCDGCLVGRLAFATGFSLVSRGGRVAVFVMGDWRAESGPDLAGPRDWAARLAVAPTAGARLRWGPVTLLISGEWVWLPGAREWWTYGAEATLRVAVGQTLGIQLASRLAERQLQVDGGLLIDF